MSFDTFRSFVNRAIKMPMAIRYHLLQNDLKNIFEYQEQFLFETIQDSSLSTYGNLYNFGNINTINQYQRTVPLSTYETLFPFIERCMKGEVNILTANTILWFAQTAGTTGSNCKYIPVTEESLQYNHFKCSKDFFSIYLNQNPESQLLKGLGIVLAGGFTQNPYTEKKNVGYISAILNKEKPRRGEYFSALDESILGISDRSKKLEHIASRYQHQSITSISGVGPWIVMLGEYIKNSSGKTIQELRPSFELILSGGVNIKLYTEQYKEVFGSTTTIYNMYNASEGFYGFQVENNNHDILLATNHGIFYEFISMEEYDGISSKTITLDQVQLHKNYAVVITTNAGLRRYITGDTVRFTALHPFTLEVTGRTSYYIDVFSEHVVFQNAIDALKKASNECNCIIKERTVGPHFIEISKKGCHERIIEFSQNPEDMDMFCKVLDQAMKKCNDYYAGKRANDTLMILPIVHKAPKGVFTKWMEEKGKGGGQNKIPNLRNDRTYLDQLLPYL